MFKLFKVEIMVIKVNLTDVRPHLSELIGKVEFGGETVIIERFGVPTAALVSMADLRRIWTEEADEIADGVNPRTGVRGSLVTVEKLWARFWG